MIKVGVDFSISSPCVCFWNSTKEHLFENCEFFFLSSRPSISKIAFPSNVTHAISSFSKNNSIRFSENAGLLVEQIKKRLDISTNYAIMLEGYSMGAKGRLFDIGEATGIFKLYLNNEGYQPVIVAPTSVKKLATGKGNANKWQMFDKFIEINKKLENASWIELLKTDKQLLAPLPDIVDAYHIANSFTVTYDNNHSS